MPIMAAVNWVVVSTWAGAGILPTDVLLTFLVCGSIATRGHRPQAPPRRYARIYLVTIAIMLAVPLLVELGWRAEPFEWGRGLRVMQTLLWGFPLLLLPVLHAQDRGWLAVSAGLGGSIVAFASVWQWLMLPDAHRLAGFFVAGTGYDGVGQSSFNEVAAFHAIALTLMAIAHADAHSKARKMAAILFPLNAVGLVLTLSRSGMLSTIVGLGLTWVVVRRQRSGRGAPHGARLTRTTQAFRKLRAGRRWSLLAVGLSLLITAATLERLALNRYRDTFVASAQAGRNVTIRFQLWAEGLSGWLRGPKEFFLGPGVGHGLGQMGGATSDSYFIDRALQGGIIWLGAALAIVVFLPLLITSLDSAMLPILAVGLIVGLTGNTLADPSVGALWVTSIYAFVEPRQHIVEPRSDRGGVGVPAENLGRTSVAGRGAD